MDENFPQSVPLTSTRPAFSDSCKNREGKDFIPREVACSSSCLEAGLKLMCHVSGIEVGSPRRSWTPRHSSLQHYAAWCLANVVYSFVSTAVMASSTTLTMQSKRFSSAFDTVSVEQEKKKPQW